MEPDDRTEVRFGDTMAVAGKREVLVMRFDAPDTGLREVDDKELLDVPVETVNAVVTSRAIDGRTLAELTHEEAARGVFLRKIMRGGSPVAMFPETRINRGDVLTLVGPARQTTDAAQRVGFVDRVGDATDMVLVAAGIVAGALFGVPALHVGGIELGLSLSVGVLLGGLVCGWLRSVQPRLFGRIPTPTLWVFESIGLTGFVAVVGLNAGPDFVKGL